MFKPMRSYLKNKLEDSTELTKIQWKLHKFLELNPDVDHYLCDDMNRKTTIGTLLGFLIVFMFAIAICLLMIYIAMNQWHALGYLNLPDSLWWK